MAWSSKPNEYHLKNFYGNLITKNALLYKYQFIVQFFGSDIEPYGFTGKADAQNNITYFVQSANIPGTSLKNATTTFFGTDFRVPGVREYKHNWQVKILLNQELFGYKALQAWHRDISRLDIDGGGIKVIPNAYAKVDLLASDSKTITTSYILEGIWIKSLPELSLKYTNGGEQPMQVNCDFRYQYSYETTGDNQEGDPLKA